MSILSVLKSVVARVKGEPLAIWGVVLGALCAVLPAVGVPVVVVAAITTVAALLGIPVVKVQINKVAAAKAKAGK